MGIFCRALFFVPAWRLVPHAYLHPYTHESWDRPLLTSHDAEKNDNNTNTDGGRAQTQGVGSFSKFEDVRRRSGSCINQLFDLFCDSKVNYIFSIEKILSTQKKIGCYSSEKKSAKFSFSALFPTYLL